VESYNDQFSLKSVECYDSSLDTRIPVIQMSTKRWVPVIGVLDGVMYAIGGAFQKLGSSVCLKSVEAYSPITKVWSPIVNMHLSRFNSSNYKNLFFKKIFLMNLLNLNWIFNLGVFTFNGLLYVIGGSDEFLEIYYLKTNTWILEPWRKSLVNVHGAVVFDMTSHLRTH